MCSICLSWYGPQTLLPVPLAENLEKFPDLAGPSRSMMLRGTIPRTCQDPTGKLGITEPGHSG